MKISPDDVKIYVLSVITGFLVGLSSVVFIGLMHFGISTLWPNGVPTEGKHLWVVPVILTIAGLLMGLCVKYFGRNDGIGFEAVMAKAKSDGGQVKLYQVPRVVLNAFIGLISGASIGPEAPLIALGGYVGSRLGNLLKLTDEQIQAVTAIAVGTSLGVLLESLVAGPLAILESDTQLEKPAYLRLIFSIIVATGAGYALFLWLVGPILTNLHMVPAYNHFASIDMVYGFVIGVVAGIVGVAASKFIVWSVNYAKRWDNLAVLRGGLTGLLAGLIGLAAPLVLFSGDKELPQAVAQAGHLGVLVLLMLALGKIVSMSLAFAGGYQGGNIFPSFFIGGVLGLAINLMFPVVPVPVAMIACMTAIVFSMMPMPLFTLFILVVVSSGKLLPVMAVALAGAGLIMLSAQVATNTAKSGVRSRPVKAGS